MKTVEELSTTNIVRKRWLNFSNFRFDQIGDFVKRICEG